MQSEIKTAVELLRRGGIISVPSEAGWHLACDSTNEASVERILSCDKIMGSPYLLLEHVGWVESYFDKVSDVAWQILELSHTPTIVELPHPKNVAKNLLDMYGMLGVKIAGTDFLTELCRSTRKALAVVNCKMQTSSVADLRVNFKISDNDDFKKTSIIRLEKGDIIKSIV
jgi:L-threonylcarbamoyladenylate synthase